MKHKALIFFLADKRHIVSKYSIMHFSTQPPPPKKALFSKIIAGYITNITKVFSCYASKSIHASRLRLTIQNFGRAFFAPHHARI